MYSGSDGQSAVTATVPSDDIALARLVAEYYDDPLGFVLDCYPWGEGELANAEGPDQWQQQLLRDIGAAVKERGFNGLHAVPALRFSVASGHGIGKSTITAWIVDWIMSTRPDAQGTVTANTYKQLETKTWPAIQKWTNLCITKDWFVVMGGSMYHRDHRSTWFASCQTCSEENSEAFAGQHAASSTSFYIFDEASAIPEKTWEVAEGGLTDGEPMIFAFGNPTRNTGKFYRITFGDQRNRWNYRSIDSRDSKLTNKQQINEWIQDYGEDSDFVRVRVRGIAPRASETQFIGQDLVHGAMARNVWVPEDEPLIAGVDVSGGGAAWNVICFRRGLDAKIPRIRIPGEHGKDRELMIAQLARLLSDQERPIAAMFIDSAFGAPIVERLHVLGYDNVHEVNFGGKSLDQHQANRRAYMWNEMKEWLKKGSIDRNDVKLEIDLIGPGFHLDKSSRLVIESKEEMARRGVASPDDADALALTFAQPVAPQVKQERSGYSTPVQGPNSWMA